MPTDTDESWWRRPAGGREVLTVALPLVVSSLSWTVMTFVDRVFLKWESGDAMSAAFSSGVAWFAVLCFPLGVCTYSSTFVSQYHGAQQPERIGPVTWQAAWVAAGFTPLLLLCIPLAPWVFSLADHTPVVVDYEVRYFQAISWGAPGMLIAQALSGFYSGRGRTNVVMVVDAVFSSLNVLLDWLWIFGKWGFPAMGIEGAAWATVVSLWLKAVTYVWLMLRAKNRREFGTLRGMGLDLPLLRRLLWFGGPSGFQMLLDVIGFTVFVLLLGRLGTIEAEATSMSFSISSLAFMPVWGLSLATSILVGQHLGENRDDLAARATWTTFSMGLAYMLVLSILYLVTPDLFLYSFFAGEAKGGAVLGGPVYELAVTLLQFVAAYNLFDACAMIFAGAIKGAGDTPFVMRVSLVMAILLAVASWLCVEVWPGSGVYGCWTVITAWVWIIGFAFFMRFIGGKWRSMRVIEATADSSTAIAE